MSVRAGIVVTGTEVLTGRTADRNGPWVSERLGELGVEVAHILCVGDRAADLRAALRFFAGEGLDLVVTTGGLGPTADDLTAEVVAEFSGREMELDEAMEARITEIIKGFARRFRFDPEGVRAGTRKQAMVPKGAQPLDPAGTAPGLVVPAGEQVVIVLPGPPRELHAMWDAAISSEAVQAVLAEVEPYRAAAIRMFALPESTLAKTLREISEEIEIDRLEITTCLRRGSELEIDIRYRAPEEEIATALVEALTVQHAEHIYSRQGESIDQIVAALLEGHTVAVAESCTGGLLAGRLTDLEGASEYFAGGVVAYADEAKRELLGVPAELIARHGAVSPEVAEAMADGAMRRFDADLGVGVTGIAGPGGGTEEKPVGYVCLCVKSDDGPVIARDPQLPGNRVDVRERSVAAAMHMLRRLLTDGEAPF